MRVRCSLATLMAICLGERAVMAAPAGAPAGAELAGLETYIERARGDWQVPGLAVGLVKDDAVIYAKGFGAREVGKAPRVDEHSLFQIGSLTKAFTAAALGILVDEGRIAWDDPVVKHIPSFRLADPWLTEQVTIRDLVAHRVGVEGGAYVVVPMDSARTLYEASGLKAQVPFRDTMLYSNSMYDIAGDVATAVSGMSWSEFLERRIFQPLAMSESSPSADGAGIWDEEHLAPNMYGQAPAGNAGIEDAHGANVTMPHGRGPKGPKAIPWQISVKNGGGAGSVVSSLHDLLAWARFNLREGRDSVGREILSKSTLEELHTPQIFIRESPSNSFTVVSKAVEAVSPSHERSAYAMGWFASRYRGYRYLSHMGALLGQTSMIALLPERNIGVVVLTNSSGRNGSGLLTQAVALRAVDALLGEKPHDWNRDLLRAEAARSTATQAEAARLEAAHLKGTKPSLPLERYTGEYENPQVGRVRIELVAGQLALHLPGSAPWRLQHWHHDTFRMFVSTSGVDLMNFFTAFSIDEEGRVNAFDGKWAVLGSPFVPVASRGEMRP